MLFANKFHNMTVSRCYSRTAAQRLLSLSIGGQLLFLVYFTLSASAQPNPYYCAKYAEYGWDFSKIPFPCRCDGMSSIDIAEFDDGRRILSFAIVVECGSVSRLEDIRTSWQSGYFAPTVSDASKASWNISGIQVNLTEFLLYDAEPAEEAHSLQWQELLDTPFKRGQDADVVVQWLAMEKLRKLPSDSTTDTKSIFLNSTKFRELQELRFVASAASKAAIPNDMFVVNKRPDIPLTIYFQGHNRTSYTVAANAFHQISRNRQLQSLSISGALSEVPFDMLANTQFGSRSSVYGSYDTLSFSSNNITSVEVPEKFRNQSLNFQFSQVNFDNNKLTTIGDHPLWNHMQKNAPIYTVSLIGNKISSISEKAFDGVIAAATNATKRNFDIELIQNALTQVPSFMKHVPPNVIAYIGWNNITSAKKSDFNDKWLKARKGEKWAGYLLGNPYECNRQKLSWFACWIQDIMQSMEEPPISMDCANKQQKGKTMTEWVKSTLARDGTCKGYFPDDTFFH